MAPKKVSAPGAAAL
jgi:hypothetical protein